MFALDINIKVKGSKEELLIVKDIISSFPIVKIAESEELGAHKLGKSIQESLERLDALDAQLETLLNKLE